VGQIKDEFFGRRLDIRLESNRASRRSDSSRYTDLIEAGTVGVGNLALLTG
jgi:hypothetical protein